MAEANNSRVAATAAWESLRDALAQKGRCCGRLLCAVHCSSFDCSGETMFRAHNNVSGAGHNKGTCVEYDLLPLFYLLAALLSTPLCF